MFSSCNQNFMWQKDVEEVILQQLLIDLRTTLNSKANF